MTSEQVKLIMDKMFRLEVTQYGKDSLDLTFWGIVDVWWNFVAKLLMKNGKKGSVNYQF